MRVLFKSFEALRFLFLLGLLASQFSLFSTPVGGQSVGSVSGTVRFKGSAMPGFPVTLYSAEKVFQIEADKAGNFRFPNLPPGTYDLQAVELGVEGSIYGIRVEGKDVGPLTVDAEIVEILYPLDPDCGRSFDVTYEPDAGAGGQVSGVLLLVPEVASQLARMRIDLTRPGKWHQRISQRPDPKGKFVFQNVPPGRYLLVAHHRGYWKVRRTIWVTRTDTTETKIILWKHGHRAICE